MTTVEVTIGWTKYQSLRSGPDGRPTVNGTSHIPFWDAYVPGMPQHTITVTLDLDLRNVTVDHLVRWIAEAAYEATNSPSPTTGSELSQQIYLGILETGYRGKEAGHYSLSIGDTVTVGEVMLGCTREGWQRVVQPSSWACGFCDKPTAEGERLCASCKKTAKRT